MSTINRKACRNVFVYNGSSRELIGGLCQSGSITNKSFLDMISILIICEGQYTVTHNGSVVTATNEPLELGNYHVVTEGEINVNDEFFLSRVLSFSVSGSEGSGFKDDVRSRDQRCVITGQINENAQDGVWSGYHAAHVFPVALEQVFVGSGYDRWITEDLEGRNKINSAQNGLLMLAHIHADFDNYLFSINPDDGYKVTSFLRNSHSIDGKVLDPVCRTDGDARRVSDELLRWHFRQAVLANMRGAGAPVFDFNFPPGTDVMGEILAGPHAGLRMETELEARLRFVNPGAHDIST